MYTCVFVCVCLCLCVHVCVHACLCPCAAVLCGCQRTLGAVLPSTSAAGLVCVDAAAYSRLLARELLEILLPPPPIVIKCCGQKQVMGEFGLWFQRVRDYYGRPGGMAHAAMLAGQEAESMKQRVNCR